MTAAQKIFKVRRHYNKWVADQTLEDYALRYTAKQGHTMSIERVGNTALGAAAFLALEGLAAVITLEFGFTNAIAAIVTVLALFFITGFPIAYYSAKHGLDIDLLTRGAGFGYLGSTITSLIYATFTFIFFAIEAAILASALEVLIGVPLALGYALSALFVIPIVTHGIRAISRFQVGTQWLWLLLQVAALGVVVTQEYTHFSDWAEYVPQHLPVDQKFDWLLFGAAASVLFALMAQIGEQVDYLRFLPKKTKANQRRWWFWLILAGPGWVFIGAVKMLLGSFLAYLAISEGAPVFQATDPTYLYQHIFLFLTTSPTTALVLSAVFVFICQMKINLTNAYAGSIAWSNFFSRLTHSHPGRVVWLVFNVTIALLLMELGIYQALSAILSVFAISAVSWLSSLSADLLINKPLGLSPNYVEFKRAHLYDINPVGTGSMLIATTLGLVSYLGLFGDVAKSLSHFISIATCFVCVPVIAWLTRGKYYIARQSLELVPIITLEQEKQPHQLVKLTCGICQNKFEKEDMSYCSAYQQPICSLCCSLDVRCLDSCKPQASISQQSQYFLKLFLPRSFAKAVSSRLGRFISLLVVINVINAALMMLIYKQMSPTTANEAVLLQEAMLALFFTLLIVSGVLSWLFLLAHESRVVAQKESNRQTRKLVQEIEAHKETDLALQNAKEQAERSNEAKSRYLSGISHELRTPLQSIIGYAQLLSEKENTPDSHQNGLDIIQRSGLYLADLIEGLLDISKIEAGRFDLYRNTVDLPKLIAQMESMFAMQAQAKGIKFECNMTSALPDFVSTDEKRLRQILINLLSNAIKYTPTGSVSFEVNYRFQVTEFTIRDTGLGIKEEHLSRIFNPFERVRNASTANLPGTGLGLTIVKLLTEIMGGDLQAQSRIGVGSEFKVSLMLPSVNSEKLSNAAQKIASYHGLQRTIMVVDDDPVVRGLLAEILTPIGFNVVEAENGLDCLEELEQCSPDLFILDVSMPLMDGLTLAQQLRDQSYDAPIIMLSADATEHPVPTNESSVFNQYLVKPVKNAALLDTLQFWLKLDWVYQSSESSSFDPMTKVHDQVSPLSIEEGSSIPDHEMIRELKAFAEMGYKKGVRSILDQLQHEDVLNTEQWQTLEQFYRVFQFDGMAQYLEQHSS